MTRGIQNNAPDIDTILLIYIYYKTEIGTTQNY